MLLSNYTSFDEVRAVLGVSIDELSDATLSLNLYVFNLALELDEVDLGVASYYAPFITVPAVKKTDIRFSQCVSLFSAYAVARQACAALPMFGPKEQTDGKSSLVRFANDPYKITIARINEQYQKAKVALDVAYSATQAVTAPPVSTRPYLSVVLANYDPVTG